MCEGLHIQNVSTKASSAVKNIIQYKLDTN